MSQPVPQPPPLQFSHQAHVLNECQEMFRRFMTKDEIWADDMIKISDIRLDRYGAGLVSFFDQTAAFVNGNDKVLYIIIAYFAISHHHYHYGGYELQVLGELLSSVPDPSGIFDIIERLVAHWQHRGGYKLPGCDFVGSTWWRTYRHCICKLHICFRSWDVRTRRTYLRYSVLKTGIVKDYKLEQ